FNRRLSLNQALASSFEEQVILGPNYSFIYNNQEGDKDRVYTYFKTALETSGNILYAGFKLANLKSSNDQFLILKRPFSQYFRIEADWRNYVRIRNHGMFAIRTFAGIGIPYGNSDALPFVKQFFVGGPNSLRGFLIREIGPGSYVDTLVYNPETGEESGNVGFFNQTGDIKLEINAELRFDIYKWLKGAVFVDAGNVWTIKKDTRTNGNFEINRFWKEFAVNAGVGARLDFNFFVIRLDYGFPFRDPRKVSGNRWLFENAQFRKGQFQLAIGYPF
ncbi:MAG: BamA/TamA family outer membrane protein, partial [Chitinophagales bacterium]|nr:BamA/TamA family outer membrane protein [Chitinophagales bacterium]